jgi:hypothetical protein
VLQVVFSFEKYYQSNIQHFLHSKIVRRTPNIAQMAAATGRMLKQKK